MGKKKKEEDKKYSQYLGDREKVRLDSDKIRKREVKIKILKMGLLISALFLIIIYFLLRAMFIDNVFTISIDRDFSDKSGIVAYEKLDEKNPKVLLEAENLEFVDNISGNWIPKDINEIGEGSHNGDNYIAYTFYVQNMGQHPINYWYSIPIDAVTKDVDTAVRVMLFVNGEKTVYAKKAKNGEPEPGTEEFFSDEIVVVKPRKDFEPNEIDKITIVIWMEGDDPECIDNIVGGQMKMHMDITSEKIKEKEK